MGTAKGKGPNANAKTFAYPPPMHFDLVDRVLEQSADRIATAADTEYVKHETARIAMVLDSFNRKFFGDH